MNAITIRTVINGYILDTEGERHCISTPRVFESLGAVVAFLNNNLERPIEGPDAKVKQEEVSVK